MLDYIEGLFLGKLWSDTDFENRKHVNLFILYGLFVDCIIAFTYFTGNSIPGLGKTGVIQIAILVLLFLLNPFINLRYYRMPLWGKLIVLFEKLCKNVLLVGVSTSLILPRLTVESSELQEFLITYLNSTLEHYTKMFYSSAGSFATVMGVLAGGIHVVFIFVLALVIFVCLPGVLYLAYRLIQYGYDWVINYFFLKSVKRKD